MSTSKLNCSGKLNLFEYLAVYIYELKLLMHSSDIPVALFEHLSCFYTV